MCVDIYIYIYMYIPLSPGVERSCLQRSAYGSTAPTAAKTLAPKADISLSLYIYIYINTYNHNMLCAYIHIILQ